MTDATGRIVIISDTHLGRRRGGAGAPRHLRPLWQGADTLIINGDAAEIHNAELRADAARQMTELQQMCEDDGVELLLIGGNHDPFITDRRYLSLFRREVFITHGDALHPAIAPWSVHAKRVRKVHEQAIRIANEQATAGVANLLDLQHEATQHAALAEWIAKNDPDQQPGPLTRLWQTARLPFVVAWYWYRIPRMAADYARFHAPRARFFIFGHIHHAGLWAHHGRMVINTGSFGLPFHPRGVIIEDRKLTVHAITRDGDAWVWGTRCYGRFDLHRA